MSQSQMVQLRHLKRSMIVEGQKMGTKATVHAFSDDVSRCFPKRGSRSPRKMDSLAAKIKKS